MVVKNGKKAAIGLGLIAAIGMIYAATRAKAVPPEAEFKVSNLIISPTEVQIGQPVTISCTISNVGTQAGTYTVVCEVS